MWIWLDILRMIHAVTGLRILPGPKEPLAMKEHGRNPRKCKSE